MLRFTQVARKAHRWLSYLMVFQLTIWILGGLTFAIIPFDGVIKGGNVVSQMPRPALSGEWTSGRFPEGLRT